MTAISVLFDLDGVIIDTETQYDIFWRKTGEEYQLADGFEHIVKGTTMSNILSRHLSHLSEEEQKKIEDANHQFEQTMSYEPIPGALEFIDKLKAAGIKIGLVTSSDDKKLKIVFNRLPIKELFDTIVSSDRITEGKPHPMCFLLGAKDLGALPDQCIVFEDSFQGIDAGNAAGMKVVGLSTTNPESAIQNKVWKVIPDFRELTLEDLYN